MSDSLSTSFWRGFRKGLLQGAVIGSLAAIVILLGYASDLGVLVGLLIFLPALAAGIVGLQREWWR